MHDHDNCKPVKMQYARAYIIPQVYENLFSIRDAFKRGTIFKDLYQPYRENKKSIC